MKKTNNGKPGLRSYVVLAAICTVITVLSWMGERDYQHQIEMAQLRSEVARLSAEVEPTIELSMPIERTKL